MTGPVTGSNPNSPHRPIATLNEGPLHAGLKAWYARPGDRFEVPLAGRQIDIVRGDLLIEIQTGSFGALKKKLGALVRDHPVRLVYPIPLEKWIVRLDGPAGQVLGRRKSPKRGRLVDAFVELVSLPRLFASPNFSFEILLTQQEEVRRHEEGRARRRKGWLVVERRLLTVVERRLICHAGDLQRLLPPGLPGPFTTADLARRLHITRGLAQKMAYCLREAGAIEAVGRDRHGHLYRPAPAVPTAGDQAAA
jgi:hypothetical protein